MASTLPPPLLRLRYARAAEEYCAQLPPEHFMEATPQATQREITLESLALLKVQRPDVHVFNELLVQYPYGRQDKIQHVVPDNMILIHDGPIQAEGSYDIPFQPVGPFMTLEYVSKSSRRKDYEDSFHKYERELKVPFYLTFYADNQELTLYRHNRRKYATVKPDDHDRLQVPELDLEIGILDSWMRYWYKGALLPLPAALLEELNQVKQLLEQEKRRTESLQRQLAEMRSQMEQLQRKQKNGRKNGSG